MKAVILFQTRAGIRNSFSMYILFSWKTNFLGFKSIKADKVVGMKLGYPLDIER